MLSIPVACRNEVLDLCQSAVVVPRIVEPPETGLYRDEFGVFVITLKSNGLVDQEGTFETTIRTM